MANNDVEMEETHKPDSGANMKESNDKVQESEIELEENDLPSAVTIGENANQSENGDENLNKLCNEAKDQRPAMSEMETQNNHERETNEPMSVEGVEPTGVQNDSESKNEEEIITEANAEVQTASGSIVDKLTNVKNEVIEETDAYEGLKEENPTGNVVKSEIPVTSVGGNSNGDVVVEKPKDSGENEECVKTVAKIEMAYENADIAGDSSEHNKLHTVTSVGGNSNGDVVVEKPKDSGENEECVKTVAKIEMAYEKADIAGDSSEHNKLHTELSLNEVPQVQTITSVEVPRSVDEEMEDAANVNEDKAVNDQPKQQSKEILRAGPLIDEKTKSVDTETRLEQNDSSIPNRHEATTPNSLVRYLPPSTGNHSGETDKTFYSKSSLPLMAEGDDGTPEDQAAFIRELESFYRERAMDFKPPKFYGQPLNCLKLWRAVIRLGGYDRVTGSKLWRQVGESFHPPKTCTTVSWTFRIFYEKSLLEYERHKRQSGDLQLPVAILPEDSGPDIEGNGHQGSGSGRARRDAAARAMQGWHVQRLFNIREVGEPVTKDKNINNMVKREKNIKSIASLKQKRPNEVDHPVKAARTETSKLVTSVVDIGPAADWVKINVRQMKDCFEVYALVPGLLREEVRVQSDPAGRLVITGDPEQVDNPWGITPFKKVVNLPARIDPHQTSAVVSLNGRLFVRVPFESNI